MLDAARCEVLEVHQLLESWFVGAVPENDAALVRFLDVLAPDFEAVMPSGRLVDRAALVARLHELHGQWRDAHRRGRIRIERLHARALGEAVVLVTYEEWQDYGATSRGRQASAVLASADSPAPNGLRWLHLHETWLSP